MTTRSCLLAALITVSLSGISLAAPPMGLSAGGTGRIAVVMTAVTLADDCGRAAGAPATEAKSKAKMDMQHAARARRACEQSSMQLSVTGADSSGSLEVKKVELFDQAGALIGALYAREPTQWTEGGAYRVWDQSVGAGQRLSVSYALSQPDWSTVPSRWNKTFVVKALISVSGADQTVQRDVRVAAPPTSLPADVKT